MTEEDRLPDHDGFNAGARIGVTVQPMRPEQQ